MQSQNPNHITPWERYEGFVIPSLLPPLLFVKYNRWLISGVRPLSQQKPYTVWFHTGHYEHKTFTWAMHWSSFQIQWAVESTGNRSGDSQLHRESTGHSAVDKSCVCLAWLILPSLHLILAFPLSSILDRRRNTADYVLVPQVFQVNIISPLEYKAHIVSAELHLNHAASSSSARSHSANSTPPPLLHSSLPPTGLLINIFDIKKRVVPTTPTCERLRWN